MNLVHLTPSAQDLLAGRRVGATSTDHPAAIAWLCSPATLVSFTKSPRLSTIVRAAGILFGVFLS